MHYVFLMLCTTQWEHVWYSIVCSPFDYFMWHQAYLIKDIKCCLNAVPTPEMAAQPQASNEITYLAGVGLVGLFAAVVHCSSRQCWVDIGPTLFQRLARRRHCHCCRLDFLKVIYHPLYSMNNYVLIWGDWLSCDPLRESHDSKSPHIWGWLAIMWPSQRVTW